MYQNKLIVNNTDVPGIVDMNIGPEPLWGEGTGREAIDGHYSGTFTGYFTTLEISFGKVTDDEFNLIKKLLEHPFLENVKYSLEKDIGDYKQGEIYTEDFYNGAVIKSTPVASGGFWNEFSVTLTATDRRPQLS